MDCVYRKTQRDIRGEGRRGKVSTLGQESWHAGNPGRHKLESSVLWSFQRDKFKLDLVFHLNVEVMNTWFLIALKDTRSPFLAKCVFRPVHYEITASEQ